MTVPAPRLRVSHGLVPFFRPSITQAEIDEVTDTLRSGHLTTGPKTARFEADFAEFVGMPFAIAVNSATAALHLALEAIGVGPGDSVLVPTMTFAATAEVVRHLGAVPVLVDCDPVTLCMDIDALTHTLNAMRSQSDCAGLRAPFGPVKAVITMHYGGQMLDTAAVRALSGEFGFRVIEDASHALPAMFRPTADAPWQSVGTTADITCFSFYANKSITTGEGGMAVTANAEWADRMRLMSLHGIARRGGQFSESGSWSYQIVEAGFKYNLTDISAAIGIHQLRRANEMWRARRRIAGRYIDALGTGLGIEVPRELPNRRHGWHLFAIRLQDAAWRISRDQVIEEMSMLGIQCSAHWMPLHLHPHYANAYGYTPGVFPASENVWPQLVSLPLFPSMSEADIQRVVDAIVEIAQTHRA